MLNQDPSRFIQDLCLTKLDKVGTTYFKLERAFLQIINASKQKGIEVRTLKNQKKKSKRKQKKIEKIIRDEVLRIIESVIRKVDSQEEDKVPLDEDLRAHKRNNSDCMELALSEAILKLFD